MTFKPTAQIRALMSALVVATLLAGCVTSSDSRFAREEDKHKAVRNYVQLATAYIGQGNLDRARTHLERAFELDDSNPAALSAMGLLYSSEGETKLAEESFQKALSKDSGYTRGRVYYGAFLYSNRRFEDARQQFRLASRDTSYDDRGSVFFNLGMTEERMANNQGAIAAYQRAVELTRGDARSLLALSRVLVEAGEYDQAAHYYSRLTTMMQRNPRLKHSPESLYTGIRIARHFNDRNRESSLALLLKNEYPGSVEYQQYRVLSSDVE